MLLNRLAPLIAAVLLTLFAAPAAAQSVDDQDRAQIQTRIEALSASISAGDFAGAMDVVPPRVIDAIVARFGIPRDQLKPAVRQAMAQSMDGVRIQGYGMDLAAAQVLTTPNGTRTYLLIPTWTEMTVQSMGAFRADNHTLAFEDDGAWYLVRVEDAAQAALLREVYPEFVGVEFPAGTTKQLP